LVYEERSGPPVRGGSRNGHPQCRHTPSRELKSRWIGFPLSFICCLHGWSFPNMIVAPRLSLKFACDYSATRACDQGLRRCGRR
jgi:hypothetical protein